MQTIDDIFWNRQDEILTAWLDELRKSYAERPDGAEILNGLGAELRQLLRALGKAAAAGGYIDAAKSEEVGAAVRHLSAVRARSGFSPTETAGVLAALRGAVTGILDRDAGADTARVAEQMASFGPMVEQLVFTSFAAYVDARDDVIRRQSLAMLEMSTPALKVWEGLVLMPLVGVVDTMRAQQVMEHLLEAVAAEEARVAIIDVTGVPVIDTRVALHLTRTVTALGMLGARAIITGISPDTAQTLVKLDVDLSAILTRGSLQAGLTAAFRLLGLRINGRE